MDWKLFSSTYLLVFLAEIPDKTALAVVLLASRRHPFAVFSGVCLAFAVQCAVAVSFGSLLSLLPRSVIHGGAALLFFVFAYLMWFRQEDAETKGQGVDPKESFRKTLQASFLIIFVAEWGDLTQLATATLQAQYRQPLLLFAASTLALWSTTALFVFVGHQSKKFINPKKLQKVGAIAFAAVGLWMVYASLRG